MQWTSTFWGLFGALPSKPILALPSPPPPPSQPGGEFAFSAAIEFHVVDVSAGDILYIPAGYGHQIVTTEERSIAMSFWWDQTGVPSESVLF